MSLANRKRTRPGPALSAAVAAIAIAPAACPAAGKSPAAVFYQVCYSNGDVRNLSAAPTTNKGIDSVTRVARYDGGPNGYTILSTGPRPVRSVRVGRTVRQQLQWHGKAWMSAEQIARERGAAAAARMVEIVRRQVGDYQKKLAAARQQAKNGSEAVAEAQKLLETVKGADGEKPARSLLARAVAARDKARRLVADRQAKLSALKNVQKQLGPATGEVSPTEAGEWSRTDAGVVKPITGRRVLPYRTQVWKLAPGKGERTIRVSIAHPQAGDLGAFHYVAYADTDGDGKPDTIIAHSPLARAATPGGWTSWQFRTGQPTVFVGNAWSDPHTSVYWGAAVPGQFNWRGLSSEVYVSGLFGAIPRRRGLVAYWTNIRVRYHDGNPEPLPGTRRPPIVVPGQD